MSSEEPTAAGAATGSDVNSDEEGTPGYTAPAKVLTTP